jgi:TolB-like protein/Flp pilus assembly protein TadD
MRLVSELRRRNVFRMTVLYAVAAWLIMQVAEVLIDLAKLPDWIGTTTLWLLAVGFPIALVFSWFYEITPEGVSLEKDVAPGESITQVTGRRLDFIVISMLCAAVILFAYDKWWIGPPPENSIAVLPFQNMSGDPEQEYFSDGVSEELLNVLAKLPGLLVVASTSSFQFRGEDRDIIDIGEQLNVGLVLEGSIRKAGTQIRINAQLIDARNGFHLWSETYDRKLENIFALQDEVSNAIVEALAEHLGLQVDAAPRGVAAADTEAHDAYLRGRYLMVQRTPSTIEGAIREFEKAISLDPDYALAHAALSRAIALMPEFTGQNNADAFARAAPHAERAMDLDPSLAEAHAAAGYLLYIQGNIEDALTHLRRAIQINRNYSWAHLITAGSLGSLGRYAEYFVEVETALRLDPLSVPARSWYINALINRNRLDKAEREMEKLASIAPVYYTFFLGQLNSSGGEWANGMLDYLDSWRIDPTPVYSRRELSLYLAIVGLEGEALAIPDVSPATALRFLGRHADAAAIAETLLANDPRSTYARSAFGLALARAGDYERARPILEGMWQRSEGLVTNSGVFGPQSAAALIAIRRDAGEEAGVDELLVAMRDNVYRLREAGVTGSGHTDYQDGLVTYLAGERTRGLALFAKAMEQGDVHPPRMTYLQALYDDPGYAAIVATEESLKTRERSRFLAVVCTDNPYAAFWQPADGTCEQFAAAGRN